MWLAEALAGKLCPASWEEGRCHVGLPTHLQTWRRSWGRWMLGWDPGSTPLPDRPAPVAPWSATSTPWWQPWNRWLASPARAGWDTWRDWRRFTARCWGQQRPPGGAVKVSGGQPRDPARDARKPGCTCLESSCLVERLDT